MKETKKKKYMENDPKIKFVVFEQAGTEFIS